MPTNQVEQGTLLPVPAYEICTVADFLKVPVERRRACLRDFATWLDIQEPLLRLMEAAGAEPGQFVFRNEIFVWIDDGKREMKVEIRTLPEEPEKETECSAATSTYSNAN
jgi:hypothetical protein